MLKILILCLKGGKRKVEKYDLRDGETKRLVDHLQGSSSRVYDFESVRYNIDNCECPGCPCCDPEMPWLWSVGAGVLAATTPIMIATAPA